MDTLLAEEKAQTVSTLAPDSFFFMSPYRSPTVSGRPAHYVEPTIDGDSPDSPFQRETNVLFADAKSQGITSPAMAGAIPLNTR